MRNRAITGGTMKCYLLPLLILAICCPAAAHGRGKRGKIISVLDGDTLKVLYDGRRQTIRLIGIDAPETRRNRKAYKDSSRGRRDVDTIVMQGKMAKNYVKTLVKKGDTGRIEFDIEKRDRYRRLLGYVYLPDGRMLNDLIIRNGYASPLTIPPNVRYWRKFSRSYKYARRHRLGLWK